MSKIDFTSPASVLVDNQGVILGKANELNFVGAGVVAALVGKKATITIPGGVSSIPISRTVFVDYVFGNDATGLPQRLDKPFKTKVAAILSAITLTPTATDRVLISVAMGTSSEPIYFPSAQSGIDFDLNGGSIITANATYAAFDDSNGAGGNYAIDSIVYNAETLSHTLAGKQGLLTANSTSLVIINGNVSSDLNIGAKCSDGIQLINGNVSGVLSLQLLAGTQTINGDCTGDIESYSGVQYVEGNIGGGVRCIGGVQTIIGNVTPAALVLGAECAGIQLIVGNVDANTTGIECTAGNQTIFGNVSSLVANGANCTGGIQIVHGNVDTAAPGIAVRSLGGKTEIHGNITSNDIGIDSDNSTVEIFGNIDTAGIGINSSNIGEIIVFGNVTSLGTYAVYNIGATQTIRGNVYSGFGIGVYNEGIQIIYGEILADGGIGAENKTGRQHIYGNVFGGIDKGAYNYNGGEQYIYGNVSSSGSQGIKCDDGKQFVKGNVFSSAGFAAYCIGGYQEIRGNITSIASISSLCSGGIQYIYGDVNSTAHNSVECNGGTQYLYGNSHSTVGIAAICINAGIQNVNGNLLSDTFHASWCDTGGVQTINNARIVPGGGFACVYKEAGTLILNNCILFDPTATICITTTTAQNIVIYGRCVSNSPIQLVPVVTLLVGTIANGGFIQSDPNVI